ncbi:MAG: hypothetical protein IT424_15795 [Pirellulales bacterium]|nr:hypothetical protein [Pirellulales bacterium]
MKRSFHTSLSINQNTGELMAVYFQVRKGKAADVKEFANGAAFGNYSRNGELLGVELLGPCKLSVLDRITPDRTERNFIRQSIPKKMA